MRRPLLIVLLAAALAACGSSASTSGASSRPTGAGAATSAGAPGAGTTAAGATAAAGASGLPAVTGAFGTKPKVATPKGNQPTALATQVLTPGTGAAVAAGDLVFVDYLGVTWAGKEFDNSFDRGEPFSFTVGAGKVIKGWDQGLVGQKVGSRIVLGIPSALGYGAQGAGADIPPNTSLVFVVDVRAAFPANAAAKGTATPSSDPALPTVTGEGAALAVAVPKVAAPTSLVVKTLVQGDGPVVAKGQQLVVQYLGALWDGGTVFDSSWKRGAPANFAIGVGKVIPGWDEALVGVKAGSRVLLVIPSDKAYGDAGRPPTIPAKATLVFVVDVLGAL